MDIPHLICTEISKGGTSVSVLLTDVDFLDDDDTFRRFYAEVSENRREKIDRLIFRKDKNLSLGAGILIDRGLRKRGLCEKDMLYGEVQSGKPFFRNRADIFFNISHSGKKVLAVFANSAVGCDIEKIEEIDLKIADKFFCKSEVQYINSAESNEERFRRFYRVWVMKESYTKAIGTGLFTELDSFCVCDSSGKAAVIRGEGGKKLSFEEPSGIGGYCAALCAEYVE